MPDRPTTRRRLLQGMLNSSLGWRLFGLFLLAIAIPAAVLTVFVERQLHQEEASARTAVLGTRARMLGMQTLDRLVSAQAALHAYTRDLSAPASGAETVVSATASPASPLARVELADRDSLGAALAGPGSVDGGAQRHDRLLVDRSAPGEHVVVRIAHQDRHGRWWLGQVDADYLWAYADALPEGVRACARADGLLLWCSDAESWAAGQAGELASRAPFDWQLFLPSRFDAVPWTFTADLNDDTASRTALEAGSRHLLAFLTALCTAALLAAALLRRIMAPLEALHRSARRWADGDLDARARLVGGDEFAQLGHTFDEMATRVQRQRERDAALSRLDRAVLETGDLDGALSRFAADLSRALGPAARVGIAYRTGTAGDRWPCVVVGRGEDERRFEWACATTDGPTPKTPTDDQRHEDHLRAALLGRDTGLSARVVWQGECLGLLAIDPGTASAAELEALDVQEVCAHMALALGAVRREGQLRDQARSDSLTGLPNRLGMLAHLERRLGPTGDGRPPPLSLLFVDLDHFKPINDGHGHLAGDAVLIEVAKRLAANVGPDGFVARPAGDEFVVVLEPDGASDHDVQVARRMIASLAQPVRVGGTSFALGASIGIARAPVHGTRADDLLRRADMAMYASKRAGRGRVTVFEERQEEATQRRWWIERELGSAIDGDGLVLLFQPRVEARHHRCISVEALVRWVHPTRGVVPPGDFIPVAEEGPLIEKLGGWVIDEACRQLAQWRGGPLGNLKVAVNVSVRQLAGEGLPARIAAALRRHGVDARQFEIEVTESVMADNLDVVFAQLEQIRAMGVEVALDDFGTGYSSMSLLRRLPIDVLKIDRAFVSEIGKEASARAVSASIIALGHQLGKRVVAEGVETTEQARWLADAGADELQGYLFSRPLGAVDLARHLAAPAQAVAPAPTPTTAAPQTA